MQSKIRVRTAGLTWAMFRSLMPGGERLLPLAKMIRFYIGRELDFDVQCVVRPGQVPPCRLTLDPGEGPRLGWNTWLTSEALDRPVDDAVFTLPNA